MLLPIFSGQPRDAGSNASPSPSPSPSTEASPSPPSSSPEPSESAPQTDSTVHDGSEDDGIYQSAPAEPVGSGTAPTASPTDASATEPGMSGDAADPSSTQPGQAGSNNSEQTSDTDANPQIAPASTAGSGSQSREGSDTPSLATGPTPAVIGPPKARALEEIEPQGAMFRQQILEGVARHETDGRVRALDALQSRLASLLIGDLARSHETPERPLLSTEPIIRLPVETVVKTYREA